MGAVIHYLEVPAFIAEVSQRMFLARGMSYVLSDRQITFPSITNTIRP